MVIRLWAALLALMTCTGLAHAQNRNDSLKELEALQTQFLDEQQKAQRLVTAKFDDLIAKGSSSDGQPSSPSAGSTRAAEQ